MRLSLPKRPSLEDDPTFSTLRLSDWAQQTCMLPGEIASVQSSAASDSEGVFPGEHQLGQVIVPVNITPGFAGVPIGTAATRFVPFMTALNGCVVKVSPSTLLELA